MRERHLRFFTRFRMLVPSVKGTFTDGDDSLRAAVQSLVGALSEQLQLDSTEWQVGTSKVFLRRALTEKLDGLVRARVQAGGRVLQRAWRRYRQSFASVVAQTAVRGLIARRYAARWRKGSLFMQRSIRAFLALRRVAALKAVRDRGVWALTILQGVARGKIARVEEARRRLPDPLELVAALKTETAKLEQAEAAKAYADCAALQLSLGALQRHRETYWTSVLGLGGGGGGTAVTQLREQITQLKAEQSAAMESKLFDRCESIQTELGTLEAQLELLPSAEELARMVGQAELEVQRAAAEKRFKDCEPLQRRLTALQAAHAALMSEPTAQPSSSEATAQPEVAEECVDEPEDMRTAAELDVEIAAVKAEMQDAVNRQDFAACAAIKERAEILEKLREKVPTAAELDERIVSTQELLDAAMGHQEFDRCHELKGQLLALQNQRAEMPMPEHEPSAAELDQQIVETQAALVLSLKEQAFAEVRSFVHALNRCCNRLTDDTCVSFELTHAVPYAEEQAGNFESAKRQLANTRGLSPCSPNVL
jgi:myosin heavy subunit